MGLLEIMWHGKLFYNNDKVDIITLTTQPKKKEKKTVNNMQSMTSHY